MSGQIILCQLVIQFLTKNTVKCLLIKIITFVNVLLLNFSYFFHLLNFFFFASLHTGTQVMANFWAIHHNEQYWDEPHEFMPERFLTPEGHLRGLSDFPFFMPFSTGQRRCMGQTIAQAELLVLLGTLLQKFTFELPEDVEADLEGEAMFSLIPKPYKIIARRRDV